MKLKWKEKEGKVEKQETEQSRQKSKSFKDRKEGKKYVTGKRKLKLEWRTRDSKSKSLRKRTFIIDVSHRSRIVKRVQ